MRRRYRSTRSSKRTRQSSSDCNPSACATRRWGASTDRDAMSSWNPMYVCMYVVVHSPRNLWGTSLVVNLLVGSLQPSA